MPLAPTMNPNPVDDVDFDGDSVESDTDGTITQNASTAPVEAIQEEQSRVDTVASFCRSSSYPAFNVDHDADDTGK